MENNKKKDNSRRSALKKIAGTGALILGMPLSNMLWATPDSGIVEDNISKGKVGAKKIASPLYASVTTRCAFVTTNSTTRPLFGTLSTRPTTATTPTTLSPID